MRGGLVVTGATKVPVTEMASLFTKGKDLPTVEKNFIEVDLVV